MAGSTLHSRRRQPNVSVTLIRDPRSPSAIATETTTWHGFGLWRRSWLSKRLLLHEDVDLVVEAAAQRYDVFTATSASADSLIASR